MGPASSSWMMSGRLVRRMIGYKPFSCLPLLSLIWKPFSAAAAQVDGAS
jgi:hypothetical protein